MTSALTADQLYQRLAYRGQVSREKLAEATQALKPGSYVFVSTSARPNNRERRFAVLAYLGYSTGARWRTRRWKILSPEAFKRVPSQYHTFLDHVEFQAGGK